jgi:aminoglycoside phosphotransferase (APT) family kinase protein
MKPIIWESQSADMNSHQNSSFNELLASAPTEEAIAEPLLAYLRSKLNRKSMGYAESPKKLTGGFDTSIFRFSLAAAPDPFSDNLVIRLFGPSEVSARATFEAAVQSAVAQLDYPAPDVFFSATHDEILAREFLIMRHMPGHTLGKELMATDDQGIAHRLKTLLPGVSEKVNRLWPVMAAAHFRLHQLSVEPLKSALTAAGISVSAFTLEGRLDALRIASLKVELAGLRPVVAWLDANRPPQHRLAVCHCDFHPFNILLQNGRVSGVLDWANTMIGDPAMDLGFTLVAIADGPIKTPRLIEPLVRGKLRAAAQDYSHAYRQFSDLDERAIDYYQVFACASQLKWALEAMIHGHGSGAFASKDGAARLARHIESLSGLELRIG